MASGREASPPREVATTSSSETAQYGGRLPDKRNRSSSSLGKSWAKATDDIRTATDDRESRNDMMVNPPEKPLVASTLEPCIKLRNNHLLLKQLQGVTGRVNRDWYLS